MPNNSLKEHLLAIIKKSKEISHSKLDKNRKSGMLKEEDEQAEQQQNTNEQQKASKVQIILFLLIFDKYFFQKKLYIVRKLIGHWDLKKIKKAQVSLTLVLIVCHYKRDKNWWFSCLTNY